MRPPKSRRRERSEILSSGRMSPLQYGSMRKFSVFAWSATSESAVVRCKPAKVRSYCCLRRVVRSTSLPRMMEMASCTSLSRFRPPSWRDGKHGLRRTESPSKRSAQAPASHVWPPPIPVLAIQFEIYAELPARHQRRVNARTRDSAVSRPSAATCSGRMHCRVRELRLIDSPS
jgi:hypothetical protein